MSVIRLLPDALKNKIAAGEVVERPASVVKELVENSLDAGSSRIEVEVERGGRKLLRVVDDGSGMDRDDALLCLERHATSKLGSEEDLFNIKTLGFRGEALPSIASVSRLTLTTAPRGEGVGVALEVEGGEVASFREAPSEGTDVSVRDLFFNTPARRKFLKRESTELLHIVDAVTRAALSHPEVGFRLRSDGQETMNLPRASGLRERLAQVYGTEFLDGLLEVKGEAGGLSLEAFVSRPRNFRETRAHQFIFINGRPVRDPSLSHALQSAYEGLVHGDRYPIYFVFLRMDPTVVDFNVHPTKREVRFQDKEAVYRFVKGRVADALRGTAVQLSPDDSSVAGEPAFQAAGGGASPAYTPPGTYVSGEARQFQVSEPMALEYAVEAPFIYLGDVFVALAEGGGLTLVDHHAAHERVLYERLLNGLRLQSRQLLFPRQVKLSPREHMLVLEHREMLHEFGIEVEDFGHGTVAVRSLPEKLEEADLRGILSDAAEEMRAGQRPGRSLKEAVAARIACHGSVRGKRLLGREEVRALLADLENTRDPEHCPHGRPTRVRYSTDDLKRLFKRK